MSHLTVFDDCYIEVCLKSNLYLLLSDNKHLRLPPRIQYCSLPRCRGIDSEVEVSWSFDVLPGSYFTCRFIYDKSGKPLYTTPVVFVKDSTKTPLSDGVWGPINDKDIPSVKRIAPSETRYEIGTLLPDANTVWGLANQENQEGNTMEHVSVAHLFKRELPDDLNNSKFTVNVAQMFIGREIVINPSYIMSAELIEESAVLESIVRWHFAGLPGFIETAMILDPVERELLEVIGMTYYPEGHGKDGGVVLEDGEYELVNGALLHRDTAELSGTNLHPTVLECYRAAITGSDSPRGITHDLLVDYNAESFTFNLLHNNVGFNPTLPTAMRPRLLSAKKNVEMTESFSNGEEVYEVRWAIGGFPGVFIANYIYTSTPVPCLDDLRYCPTIEQIKGLDAEVYHLKDDLMILRSRGLRILPLKADAITTSPVDTLLPRPELVRGVNDPAETMNYVFFYGGNLAISRPAKPNITLLDAVPVPDQPGRYRIKFLCDELGKIWAGVKLIGTGVVVEYARVAVGLSDDLYKITRSQHLERGAVYRRTGISLAKYSVGCNRDMVQLVLDRDEILEMAGELKEENNE